MKVNRSVPVATVIPVLIYPDVREAVAWLTAAFGFVERLRLGENHRSQLRVGDGAVIVAEPGGYHRPPSREAVAQYVMVRVPDAQYSLRARPGTWRGHPGGAGGLHVWRAAVWRRGLRRSSVDVHRDASGHRPADVGRSVPEPGLTASASLALTPDEAQPVSTSSAAAGS